jgi:cation diffusion facilitator family transporter
MKKQPPDVVRGNGPVTAPDNVERAGHIRKVTVVGLIVNLLLFGFKLAAGIVGSSQAVVADAVHSLSDCTTDLAIIVGARYWSQPADKNHPYGHARLETLVTIFIGIMLLGAGLGIGWNAIETFNEKHLKPPGWIAFVAAAASILCKEILYQWTARAGKRVRSAALAANAWHHRTDALSSVPVVFAVGAAVIVPSWTFLDYVGAILVSLFIFHASLKIIWPGIRELIDSGAPEEIYEKIRAIALQNPRVREVHKIRTRYVSNSVQVDLHVHVDGHLTVSEGHHIAGDVKRRILIQGPNVVDVVVHVEPASERALD